MTATGLEVDGGRLWDELQQLAVYSDTEAPSVTRIVYSDVDMQARAYVKQLCAEASLEIREDAVGNLFARWPGSQPDLPAVATGSHIDAIPHAGRYDGTLGVLGGLEAIRSLQQTGRRPRRSIELIGFTSEEPTRFGIGCFGSRFMSGALGPADADRLADNTGKTLNQVRQEAGFPGTIASVKLEPGHYAAFVELHIEQGPILEAENLPVAAITAIAAPATLRVRIDGEGGHAGAALMPTRHDAFLAGSELALAVESAAKSSGAMDSVATVGVCKLFPGAVNSIPSRVDMEIDCRDIDLARRDRMIEQIRVAADQIAARRGVQFDIQVLNADPPAQCAPDLVATIVKVCESAGIPHCQLVSRAYHDSLFMSLIAPTSMIFVRCRGGVSHRPDEYSSPEDIAAGTLVLANSLYELANS